MSESLSSRRFERSATLPSEVSVLAPMIFIFSFTLSRAPCTVRSVELPLPKHASFSSVEISVDSSVEIPLP